MRHLPIFIVTFTLILASCAELAAAQDVSFVRSVIQEITEDELRTYVQALEDVGTRYAPSAGNAKAADYIKERFLSFGLTDVTLDEFDYYDTESGLYEQTRNVVATKPGSRQPQKIVILGAHFDTVTRRAPDDETSFLDRDNPSPGADDNGTGVAAVLAAARVLSGIELDATVRFVAFSAEEGGIYGGAHYAADCARKSEDIVAVINLDMIGFSDEEPEDIDIFANPESEWLLDEMVNNAPVYTPDLLVYRIVDGTYDGSDHGPFWNNGYPAICLMEDYYPSNRHYHTPADTVETVDFSFALRCTRLAVATLAELARIQVPEEARSDKEETEVDWKRDSGRRFLFTLSPSTPHGDVIDISVPGIHSRRRIILDTVPEETWATPRFYPVASASSPSDGQVFIPMIRMRAPGDETENGVLRVIDPVKGETSREVPLGKFPGAGCFNADGTRYYPESHSVLIFDLEERNLEKRIGTIESPRDRVLVDGGRHAVVSSYAQSKVFLIGVEKNEIIDTIDCAPRPLHLIPAPKSDRFLTIHQAGDQVEIFQVVDGKLEVEERLDLEEEVVHAAFADDDKLIYFISSGGQRLFGMDLARKEIVWGMRTGDVRAKSGVEKILYIQQ